MKWEPLAALAFLALSSGPAAAEGRERLPVEAIDGRDLTLRGVIAERFEAGAHVGGWVRRRAGRFGSISAHLDVATLDASGNVLRTIESRWTGALRSGPRGHRTARFHANLDAAAVATAASVRVSVHGGIRHAPDNQ